MSTAEAPAGAAADEDGATLGISVVLPTKDRRDGVVRVVRALLADDVPDSEVVVVDDGSSDGTWAELQRLAAEDPRVVAVRQENAGKRAANATATARARGRVLLFLDDDVLPGPGLVRGHLRAHEGRDDAVVVGYMPTTVPRPTTGALFATILYAAEYEGRCEQYEADPSTILAGLWMGNVSMTRAAYERAGLAGLASFRYRHEDRDIGLACARAGLVGVFDRRLASTHRHARTVDQFVRDSVQQGAGRAALSGVHGDRAAFSIDDTSSGLPRPVAVLVRMTRRPWVRRPVAAALVAALRLAVRLPSPGPALVVARVLRRIKHQEGAQGILAGEAAVTAGSF